MNKKTVALLIGLAMAIGLFFQLYKAQEVPPCLNADEAAFGYNAYSILKTGRDEYGKTLPLRLTSFGDYKLPLYSYLSIPSIALFGLNDFSVRALNILLGVALIPLTFFVTKEFFEDRRVGIIATFLVALNTSHYILTRHAHEGVSSAFFILLGLLFFLRYHKKPRFKLFAFSSLAFLLAAFSYHSGRLFLLFFGLVLGYLLIKQKRGRYLAILIPILAIPFLVDFAYGAHRVTNLAFYKDPGFVLRINEALSEHPARLIHNKATQALIEVTGKYLAQVSPEFLALNGDSNPRFGMPGIGVITPIEYFVLFIGIYFLFAKKQRYRYLLVALLIISPISNALTWLQVSMVRTYLTIFIIIIIASYGLVQLYCALKMRFTKFLYVVVVAGAYIFYSLLAWDKYLYHYSKKPDNIRAWQCGYRQMASFVKSNYGKYDKFVISRKNGQPYIFLLYYLAYDPTKYQAQAHLSAPDEYGFGQVDRFDKFDFDFKYDPRAKNTAFIGFPEDFSSMNVKGASIGPAPGNNSIKKISINSQDVFWIVENK